MSVKYKKDRQVYPSSYHAFCGRCKQAVDPTELRMDGEKRGLRVCQSCYDPRIDRVHVKPDHYKVRRPLPHRTEGLAKEVTVADLEKSFYGDKD